MLALLPIVIIVIVPRPFALSNLVSLPAKLGLEIICRIPGPCKRNVCAPPHAITTYALTHLSPFPRSHLRLSSAFPSDTPPTRIYIPDTLLGIPDARGIIPRYSLFIPSLARCVTHLCFLTFTMYFFQGRTPTLGLRLRKLP